MKSRIVILATVILLGLLALPALAHPLGNFTTNVHLGVHAREGAVDLLLVVDMAEIPAFRESASIDGSGEGVVSASEMAGYAGAACEAHRASVVVQIDGRVTDLAATTSDMTLPEGQAGLQTLRLECGYTVSDLGSYREISVDNSVFQDRIGWAEIVATGEVVAGEVPAISPSEILTAYPDGETMDTRHAVISVSTGSPAASAPGPESAGAGGPGLIDRLAGLAANSSGPLALLAALGLGVAHALAPGHGKTLMAAYLIGRNGRPRQAVALGLSVAVSHTIGVALVGALALATSQAFRPEDIYPWLSGASAALITMIGLGMLARAFRLRGGSSHGHVHDHGHEGPDHSHDHAGDEGHDQHEHSQLPMVTGWRSMAALGLAGGMVPSASAVILLLAGIGTGRPAMGLAMVAVFGVGMSVALVGSGLVVLGVYRFSGRLFRTDRLRHRWQNLVPRLAGLAVTIGGLVLVVDVLRRV